MKTAAYAAVGPGLEGDRTVDATGKLVVPGGIEPHAHIHEPMYRGWTQGEEVWLQSPEGATRAAIFGGTTTVVSFAFMDVHVTKQEFDAAAAVEHRRRSSPAARMPTSPFTPSSPVRSRTRRSQRSATQSMTARRSMKLFTTDLTTGQAGIRIDNGSALAVMRECAEHGAMVMVHAEDDDLIKHMEAKLTREGRNDLFHAHVVHTTARGGVRGAHDGAARRRGRRPALHRPRRRTRADGRDRGASCRRSAGLRRGAPQPALLLDGRLREARRSEVPHRHGAEAAGASAGALGGLADGRLSTIATDEYTTSLRGEDGRHRPADRRPGGHVGIETRGVIAFSEGVDKGRLTLERFVEVWATNAARILGMYPQKGVLAEGSDADICVWDPDARWTITIDDLHHEGDYSPWEGWEVTGRPVTTILRGKVVVDRGELLGSPFDGQWLRRRLDPAIASGPAIG